MENTNHPQNQNANQFGNHNGNNNALPAPLPSLTMSQAVKAVFNKYADFSGRSRRSEYWYFYLFVLIVIFSLYIPIIIGVVTDNAIFSMVFGIPLLLFALATMIPNLAAIARRLHDTGRSAWNYFFVLIPLVGAILLLIWLAEDSKPGTNQWGPNPKGVNNNGFN